MRKLHAPNKLDLYFKGKLTPTMRKIAEDFKDNVTSLVIEARANVDLLLQPSFMFISLQSLSLNGFDCNENNVVRVFEAMISKHANTLQILLVDWLRKILRVPALPVLDSLILQQVDLEAAWPILEQSRPTITSLVVFSTTGSPPDEYNNPAVYQIPNIQHLTITISDRLQFVLLNAEHLVSLDLTYVIDIPNDVVWPLFPKLRELKIEVQEFIPILMNCRQTLERLVMIFILSPPDEHADMVMPRLTDLHLDHINDAFSRKICNSNHRSLEFLYFCGNVVPNLNEGVKMESLKNVVLRDKTPQDRERMLGMCPNAEVVLVGKNKKNEMIDMREMIRSRCKRKNFSLSVS